MRLQRLTLGAFLIIGASVASDARAADIYRSEPGSLKDAPVFATPVWTGFYLGVNGGYGWTNKTETIDYFAVGAGLVNRGAGFDSSGGFGGGQLGYNWQQGRLVYGIETDIQGSGIEDKFSQISAPGNVIAGLNPRGKEEFNYFGTVRGRLGYAFDNTLLFATAGFAYGGMKRSVDVLAGNVVAATFKRDETETGYAVGGGFEQFVSPAWTIKVEYQYINLGSAMLVGTAPAFGGIATFTNKLDADYHTFRVGLNYHVGSTYEPLK